MLTDAQWQENKKHKINPLLLTPIVRIRIDSVNQCRQVVDTLAHNALNDEESRERFISTMDDLIPDLAKGIADEHPQILAHPDYIEAVSLLKLHLSEVLEGVKRAPTREAIAKRVDAWIGILSPVFRKIFPKLAKEEKKGPPEIWT
jgi:hypothetical protein